MYNHKSDSASLLWSRLVDNELKRVVTDPHLKLRVLSKHINPNQFPEHDPVVSEAHSSTEAAAFYKNVLSYVSEDASDALRRLPDFIDDLASGNVDMKSTSKAAHYRRLGNQLFKVGDMANAATAYRTGLLHAPAAYPYSTARASGLELSVEAALLHGNLSAVLAHKQLWSECLWEANIALELHLLRSATDKAHLQTMNRLWSRVKKCCTCLKLESLPNLAQISSPNLELVTLIRENFLSWSFPDRTNSNSECQFNVPVPQYGYNEMYPGLSAGLKVENSIKKGRHVVATKDFQPGDVIAAEPACGWYMPPNGVEPGYLPGALLLLPAQRMNRCTACLAPLQAVGFVCPDCLDAAYCAPPSECFKEHCSQFDASNRSSQWRFTQPRWHSAECRFMFLLNSTGLGHPSFRIAWLLRFAQKQPQTRSSVTVDSLVDHYKKFVPEDLFQYALTAWLLSCLMAKCATYDDRLTSENAKLVDGLRCFDILRRLQCNAHAVVEIQEECPLEGDLQGNDLSLTREQTPFPPRRLEQVRMATGLFPCISMFNHSCDPSIFNTFEGPYLIVRCIKPIKQADEVRNCYGPHYLHHPSADSRRQLLRQQYFFDCDCVQCAHPKCQCAKEVTDEARESWNKACDEVLSNCYLPTTFDELQQRIRTLEQRGTVRCDKCSDHWWPTEDSLGSLMDAIGRRYLSFANETSEPACRMNLNTLGLWCLQQSVSWTYRFFGLNSSEYLWEVVNLIRVTIFLFKKWPSYCGDVVDKLPPPDAEAIPSSPKALCARLNQVARIFYGEVKASELLTRFMPSSFIDTKL
ncbi:unnamed protein product [Calicophoron daubneyi]|uniref:SET domain-containing protein n=1 Tax=Calicophoron daubneyi TaxID=300641 RepID=A0AAV2TDE0_CALDB